jgi:hypothetical protein
MSNRTFSPDLPGSLAWLQHHVDTVPHGEVTLTVRLHADREPIIERVLMERVKDTTGKAGVQHEHRRR